MNFILHSKIVASLIHIVALAIAIWFFFPNLFTHRDIPRWPVFANASVEGVDSNHNGLRDDVEIRIHRAVDNDQDYLKVISYAASLERRIRYKANTRSEGLLFFRNDWCTHPGREMLRRYGLTEQGIEHYIYNTKARIDTEEKNVTLLVGGVDSLEIECGSEYDLSEELQKYSLRPKKK